MEPIPDDPESWKFAGEFPNAFELPQEFRKSLPKLVQEWLNSVERRIDGMTLDRIRQEAYDLYDNDSPDGTENSLDENGLYRLGRRLFYARMQQIVGIMFPGQRVDIGIDLLWGQADGALPGFAVTDAVMDGNNNNQDCLRKLKAAGFAVQPWS